MLFTERLESQQTIVREAVKELFDEASRNQTHPQDLLLVLEHGSVDASHPDVPIIGPNLIGISEKTQYEFYGWYRKNYVIEEEIGQKSRANKEYLEMEGLTIHIEKVIYLKFWESDMIIKYLLQLVNLVKGQPYNWYLRIPIENREGGKQKIIREDIRDRIKDTCNNFYALIKETYSSQLRNAIAHSQYYIVDRIIGFLNYSENEKAYCPIKSLTFDEWAKYSHNTILIYNELIRCIIIWRDFYRSKFQSDGPLDVRITRTNGDVLYGRVGVNDAGYVWRWQ